MYTLIIEDKNGVIADEFSFSEGSYRIGRVEGNDIILPSSNVSRQHSRLFIRSGNCYIEDMGSSNGVFVDGQRIQGERNLGSGAQIRIGDYYLYLEFNRDDTDGQNDVVSTHIVSQDANANKLIRVRDAFAGEEFVLSEHHNTIGRTDENYILLNDQSISRRHALLENNGLVYALSDMGSSNGTFVNNKQIENTTILKEGDAVRFGNVEFVYVSNDEPYDPVKHNAQSRGGVAATQSSKFGIALFVIGGLVLLCAFGSVIAVGGYFLLDQSPKPKPQPTVVEKTEPTAEEKVIKHIADGRSFMSSNKWEKAVERFDQALAIDADSSEAKSFKAQAKKELKSQEKFNSGMELKAKGKYEDAKGKFEKVKSGTAKHKDSQKELNEINLLLANEYKSKGIASFKKAEYDLARNTLIKSINLKCDDEVKEYIRKSEDKMRRYPRKYGTFEPFKVPPKCG